MCCFQFFASFDVLCSLVRIEGLQVLDKRVAVFLRRREQERALITLFQRVAYRGEPGAAELLSVQAYTQ